MTESKVHSVTIVVQHISESGQKPYRVVAYSDKRNYGKAEFDSLDHLRRALLAIPVLAEQVPTSEKAREHTYIIFRSIVDLTDSQLAQIGLNPS